MQHRHIAEAFSKNFQLVYSNSCPETFTFINQSKEVSSVPLA
jgi:hypothetical protein